MQTIDIAPSVQIKTVAESVPFRGLLQPTISNTGEQTLSVTLWLFSIGKSMDHLVASSPLSMVEPNGQSVATIEVSDSAPKGPYVLFATVNSPGQSVHIPASVVEPFICIWVGEPAPIDVGAAVTEAMTKQRQHIERPLYAQNYDGNQRFSVDVLLEGCMLDYPQAIEGGFMKPLHFGMSCQSEIAAINGLVGENTFKMEAPLDQAYQSDHPLTMVSFTAVFAPNEGSAYEAVMERVSLISGVLAMVRMASSRIAATLVRDVNGACKFILPRRAYPGNLVPGLVVGESAKELESFVDAALKDPWVGLIVRMYNEAVAEYDPLFKVVRLWSVLESCAKRRELPGFYAAIKDPKKKLYTISGEDIKGHDLATVCYFIQEEARAKEWGRVNANVSNCELLRRANVVRNVGAHEGVLNEATLNASAKKAAADFMFKEGGLTSLQILAQYGLSAAKRYALSMA